ncbi:MAG TPA: hypothetical protein VM143_13510 [Acidimicrobiales bacterium]|nr:hypothetical protein [Acidimicrobiales bacterium]
MTTDPPAASGPPPNLAHLAMTIDGLQPVLVSLTEVLGGVEGRLDHVEGVVRSGLDAFNARLARLEEAFVQAVDESGSGTKEVVDEVRAVVVQALEAAPIGVVTQRVAELAIGVEATRVLLEQLVRITESTIGRKAGEQARRLAADFGIRTKRAPEDRRDPRELGSS